MSERNPEYEDGGVLNGSARPCTLSEVEATRVAAAASGELEADPYDEETGPVITGFDVWSSRLAWIPLRSEKGFLSDPVSGITISEGVFE